MDYPSQYRVMVVGISRVPSRFWKQIPEDWRDLFDKSKLDEIDLLIGNDFQPSLNNIFRAFQLPIEKVKVIIVGQDPYPNPDYATGLAFSVPKEILKLPPTLKNIFKELETDLGILRSNGDLSDWCQQGVLLLNRTLTIGMNGISSHRGIGWQDITEPIVKELGRAGKIGVLWGDDAKKLKRYFDKDSLLISAHPSPLSAYRGFFGSKPFSKVNKILAAKDLAQIDW